jgi:tousled-like kinase
VSVNITFSSLCFFFLFFFSSSQEKTELEKKLETANKSVDLFKNQVSKCMDVVKNLLVEKSTIEKKEIRRKCMQNRLRLGQFVTQRVGASYQENWQDGYAFQEITKKQEQVQQQRESIEKMRKNLSKKKESTSIRKNPASGSGSGAGGASNAGGGGTWSASAGPFISGSNSNDSFLKPDAPGKDNALTLQEHYEQDEILKVSHCSSNCNHVSSL